MRNKESLSRVGVGRKLIHEFGIKQLISWLERSRGNERKKTGAVDVKLEGLVKRTMGSVKEVEQNIVARHYRLRPWIGHLQRDTSSKKKKMAI